MNDRKEDFLRLVISEDTIDLLRYLNEHGTGQYRDFMELVDVDTLQDRINRLLEYDLIRHSEEESGTEQYELTDNGRKVLQTSDLVLIHVESDNTPAVRAYTKVGFKPYRRYCVVRTGE